MKLLFKKNQMKKIVLSFLAIFSIISCKSQNKDFSKEALNEKLTGYDGSQIAFGDILKKHTGKTVVIETWASWCGDCVKAMPKIKELQAHNPDVDYVFVSMDKAEDKWKAGIEKHELK